MNSETPIYILTEAGMKKMGEEEKPPEPKPRYLVGSPFLSGSLFLALLAFYIDSGEWKGKVETLLLSRQRTAAYEPFRQWAHHHPLTYEEVQASPAAYSGKPVLWEVSRDQSGTYLYGKGSGRPLVWTNSPDEEVKRLGEETVRVMARIEGEEAGAIVLVFLEIRP